MPATAYLTRLEDEIRYGKLIRPRFVRRQACNPHADKACLRYQSEKIKILHDPGIYLDHVIVLPCQCFCYCFAVCTHKEILGSHRPRPLPYEPRGVKLHYCYIQCRVRRERTYITYCMGTRASHDMEEETWSFSHFR